jgi:GNAT superfamily N-acetyltransferase
MTYAFTGSGGTRSEEGMREMTFEIRPLDPTTDFSRVAELLSLVELEPVTEAMLLETDAARPDGEIRQQLVAVDATGVIVGFGETGRVPWHKPGLFWTFVVVAPEVRTRGIGSALFASVLEFSRGHGALTMRACTRETCADGLRFAERVGFRIERQAFESVLEIATFAESRFAGTAESLEASGLRFFTFADLEGTPEEQHRLYDLNIITGLDVPGYDDVGVRPFEQFRKDVLEAYWFRPEGQIIAADGERWVGLAALGEVSPGMMYNMMTGVLREYRGRKIALALKLRAVEVCRKLGARYMRTDNDSQNQPMLAVNRKLGYQPEPGVYVLLKEPV